MSDLRYTILCLIGVTIILTTWAVIMTIAYVCVSEGITF